MGAEVGEINWRAGRYRVRGHRARAIAAGDALLSAHYRSMLDYQTGPYADLEALLRSAPGDGAADLGSYADVIAQVSLAAAPFIASFLTRVITETRPARILDVGCGTAVYSKIAASADRRVRVVGIDLAEGVIEAARANLRAAGLAERIRLHAGDIRTLEPGAWRPLRPHPAAEQDFTTSRAGERVALYQRLRGLLSDRGQLVVASLTAPGSIAAAHLNFMLTCQAGAAALPRPGEPGGPGHRGLRHRRHPADRARRAVPGRPGGQVLTPTGGHRRELCGDEPDSPASPFSLRTAWARHETPLRQFLRTETGSAAVLLAATLAALAWANIDGSGYAAFWETELSIRVGSTGLAADLQEWVNSGLMTFFFLVAGLEARREFDMGELRERLRLTLPLLVGLGGMVVPIGIYLAVNAGQASAHGWGTAMSTDTAFALGMLALVGSGVPDRVSTYLLTFAIVDDVVALVIIALAYSGHIDPVALGVGLAILAVAVAGRAAASALARHTSWSGWRPGSRSSSPAWIRWSWAW